MLRMITNFMWANCERWRCSMVINGQFVMAGDVEDVEGGDALFCLLMAWQVRWYSHSFLGDWCLTDILFVPLLLKKSQLNIHRKNKSWLYVNTYKVRYDGVRASTPECFQQGSHIRSHFTTREHYATWLQVYKIWKAKSYYESLVNR